MRLLKEPLLHFLVLGGLMFSLFRLRDRSPGQSSRSPSSA